MPNSPAKRWPDLALALVADDLGADIAQALARWLVMWQSIENQNGGQVGG